MHFTNLSNLKEHPSYLLGKKIAEVCAPLFSNFPINYFCYTKWQKNCGAFVSTDKDWLSYYIQSSYKFLVNGKKIHSWSSDMPYQALAVATSKYDYYNGIIVEKASLGYIETLEFASPNKYADPLEFCCNKDLLNQFLLYFKNNASHIIKVIENNPICFSENRFITKDKVSRQSCSYCGEGFSSFIAHKKIRFKFQDQEVFFSPREFEVLCLLAKGKNMTEVAAMLQLSRRTVETYLYNAKNKTGAYTVNQLLDNFTDSLF